MNKNRLCRQALILACMALCLSWWHIWQLKRELRRLQPPAPSAAAAADGGARATAAAAVNNVAAEPEAPSPLMVVGAPRCDARTGAVTLLFNAPVEPETLRQSLEISGVENPGLAITALPKRWNYEFNLVCYPIEIAGDLEFRRDYRLRIGRGIADKTGNRLLSEDCELKVRRPDLPEEVHFKRRSGRYLPPGGRRSVELACVNSQHPLRIAASRIPAANIVTLLALEGSHYNDIWRASWKGERWIADLGDRPSIQPVEVKSEPNVWQTVEIALGDESGVVMAVLEQQDEDGCWRGEDGKLVCLSDLGIAVRQFADGVLARVNRLSDGLPAADAEVEVFSAANVRLAVGRTGPDGLCRLQLPPDASPLAVVASVGEDRSFIALDEGWETEEPAARACRADYLESRDLNGYIWTERAIYRPGDSILCGAVVRGSDYRAAKDVPLEIVLEGPGEGGLGSYSRTLSVKPDGCGMIEPAPIEVPADRPCGEWLLKLRLPGGKDAPVLSMRKLRVEAYTPPQVRVEIAVQSATPTNLEFSVAGEHVFGGPAAGSRSEASIAYLDVPFAPTNFAGCRFGSERRGLRANFSRLDSGVAGADGVARFANGPRMRQFGLPAAAVEAVIEGSVEELGGRLSTQRTTHRFHAYDWYVGAELPERCEPADGRISVPLFLVRPDGSRMTGGSRLSVALERVSRQVNWRRESSGRYVCDEQVSYVPSGSPETIAVDGSGAAVWTRQSPGPGEYRLTVEVPDEPAAAQFSQRFMVAGDGWGDLQTGRTGAVKITPDRRLYRPGDVPVLSVDAPFAGEAVVTLMRENCLQTFNLTLTNRITEVRTMPLRAEWTPNVDVAVEVVRAAAVGADGDRLCARGMATLMVRPDSFDLPVGIDSRCRDGRFLEVQVVAPLAQTVQVMIVDEAVFRLASGAECRIAEELYAPRRADCPLYDLYGRVLPTLGGAVAVAGGARIGGDGAEDMFRRVSLVPSRRFRQVAERRMLTPDGDGRVRTVFDVDGFSGRVRVTAVAVSAAGVGTCSRLADVVPKLVAVADAPRFAAPGDTVELTYTLANRGDAAGEVDYAFASATGRVTLAAGELRRLKARWVAPGEPGECTIGFVARGLGEAREDSIDLPVRPAAPWVQTSGVVALAKGERVRFDATGRFERVTARAGSLPAAELGAAFAWLAEYPYGCLEQTVSRVYPLLAAGGMIAAIDPEIAARRTQLVRGGVERVLSMLNDNGFTMWPDCCYAPDDPEIAVRAAEFLVRAAADDERCREMVGRKRGWLRREVDKIAADKSAAPELAARALAVLARMNVAVQAPCNRMFARSGELGVAARAHLADAFAAGGETARAHELLATAGEAADFGELCASLEALARHFPEDPRADGLAERLLGTDRDPRGCWLTTADNAQAIAALAAYYGRGGERESAAAAATRRLADGTIENLGPGRAFVRWRRWNLARGDLPATAEGLTLSRHYLRLDGEAVDWTRVRRGDLLVAVLTIGSDKPRQLSDLVIEDLLPGGLEPATPFADWSVVPGLGKDVHDWLLRSDVKDDRIIAFSKKVAISAHEKIRFCYLVRAVSSGECAHPAAMVEAMYVPGLRARTAAGRLVLRD